MASAGPSWNDSVRKACRSPSAASATAARATERECQAKGFAVQFIRGDMVDEAFCRRLVDTARERWGKINYLVNNAFSFITNGIDATREEWLRSMSVGPIGYARWPGTSFRPCASKAAARLSTFPASRPTSRNPIGGRTTPQKGLSTS